MENKDFNDVLVAGGIQMIRQQFASVINKQPQPIQPQPQPQPSQTMTDSIELNEILKRYKIVEKLGKRTNQVFDVIENRLYNKSAFDYEVGASLARKFFSHCTQFIDIDEATHLRIKTHGADADDDIFERYYLIEGTDEAWDNREYERIKVSTLSHSKPKTYKDWKESTAKKIIRKENIMFDPTGKKEPPKSGHYINTFINPWLDIPPMDFDEAKRLSKPAIDLLLHMCNGDELICDWILNWLAIPLQKPGTKMGVALLFHSPMEGAGKNLFFEHLMGKIYTDRYAVLAAQHQLESNFTAWRENKLWIVYDEIFGGKQPHELSGIMKRIITGKTVVIEHKGKDSYEVENLANFVFLSNETKPVHLSINDRRFVVVTPKNRLDTDLAESITHDLASPDGVLANAFYNFLTQKDVGEQHAYTHPISNEAKDRLIEANKASWERFIEEWSKEEGNIPFVSCPITDLFTIYKYWCYDNNEVPTKMNKFSSYIRSIDLFVIERAKYIECEQKRQRQNNFVVIVEQMGQYQNIQKQDKFSRIYKKWIDSLKAIGYHTGRLHQSSISQLVHKGKFSDE